MGFYNMPKAKRLLTLATAITTIFDYTVFVLLITPYYLMFPDNVF